MSVNPYSADWAREEPAASLALDLSWQSEIRFEGVVHRGDLLELIQRPPPASRWQRRFWWLGPLMLSLLLGTLLATTLISNWGQLVSPSVPGSPSNPPLNAPRSGQSGGQVLGQLLRPGGVFLFTLLLLLPLLLYLPVLFQRLITGPRFVRRVLRQSPWTLGPLSGRLQDGQLEWSTLYHRSSAPLQQVTGAMVSRHAVVLTFDVRQMLLVVLPQRLFSAGDFERLVSLVTPLAAGRPLTGDGNRQIDERLREQPVTRIAAPESSVASVAFAGTVTWADFYRTSLYRSTWRTALGGWWCGSWLFRLSWPGWGV